MGIGGTLFSTSGGSSTTTEVSHTTEVDLATGKPVPGGPSGQPAQDSVSPYPDGDPRAGAGGQGGSSGNVLQEVMNLIPRYSGELGRVGGTATLAEGSTQGKVTVGGTTIQGAASGKVTVSGGASATYSVGPDGIQLQAGVEGRLGVSGTVTGSMTGEWGSAHGTVTAEAALVAGARALVSVTDRGVTASASGEISGYVRVTANAEVNIGDGMLTGKFNGSAEAYAGVRAGASVALTYEPLRVAVDAKAGAFAGARASFSAQAGVAGFNVGIGMEARVGVGVEIGVKAGIDDGKLTLGFNLGLALGIGFSIRIEITIDLKPIGEFFANLFSGKLFGGGPKDAGPDMSAINDILNRMLERQLAAGAPAEGEPPPLEPPAEDELTLHPQERTDLDRPGATDVVPPGQPLPTTAVA